MNDRDILIELRAWRDEFARSHNYDLGALAASLRALDRKAGARVVRGAPRRPTPISPPGVSAPNGVACGHAGET